MPGPCQELPHVLRAAVGRRARHLEMGLRGRFRGAGCAKNAMRVRTRPHGFRVRLASRVASAPTDKEIRIAARTARRLHSSRKKMKMGFMFTIDPDHPSGPALPGEPLASRCRRCPWVDAAASSPSTSRPWTWSGWR